MYLLISRAYPQQLTPNGGFRVMVKVLIADDSPRVREEVKALLLNTSGIEIIGEATTPAETTDLTQTLTPDALILDFQTPGGLGLEMVRNIKGKHSRLVLIVLTNYVNPEYGSTCLKSGADYFFDKSFEIEKVRVAVQDLVRERGP